MPDTRSKEPIVNPMIIAAMLSSWAALVFTWFMLRKARRAERITRVLADREQRLRDRHDGMDPTKPFQQPEIRYDPDGTAVPHCRECRERFDYLGTERWGHCCPLRGGVHNHG